MAVLGIKWLHFKNKMAMKTVLIGISALMLSFATHSCSSTATAGNEVITLQQDDDKKRIVVDVRTPGEFASGAIEGAINIPVDQLQTRLNELQGYDEVIVYCASGARSSSAKRMLDKYGYSVVDGGGIQKMRNLQKT
jgi:phage shock protein E